jgi:hypothetical protein
VEFLPEGGVMAATGETIAKRPRWNHTSASRRTTQWRNQLLDEAAVVFDGEVKSAAVALAVDVKTLHAKIGELMLENDFLSGALGKAGLLSAKR